MRILITGATGFVGSALIKRLHREGVQLIAAVPEGRRQRNLPTEVAISYVQQLSESCDYTRVLQNVDIVVHLAARVHVMHENASDPLKEYRTINVVGTTRIARQAASVGVQRFVFLSTVGVHGNESFGNPICENDPKAPHNYYSISKCEAEESLAEIAAETGIEVVIIRAPLVYGPCNPGNFLTLLRFVSKNFPLPLASIRNKRSFIFVGNLVDALAQCAISSNASGQTYFVSDGEDVSTPELINRIAGALGKPSLLFPLPKKILHFAGNAIGKNTVVESLINSLQVDTTKIKRELGWVPPFTMEQGLLETAKWFRGSE